MMVGGEGISQGLVSRVDSGVVYRLPPDRDIQEDYTITTTTRTTVITHQISIQG